MNDVTGGGGVSILGSTGTIAGAAAESHTLTLVGLSQADAGTYDCVITDSCGSTISTGATLNFCYANCDCSTDSPALGASDFVCYLNKFRSGDPYANCDGSTTPPVLGASDFVCFLNAFRAGCP